MTPEQFLQDLLVTQALSPAQETKLQMHKTEVTEFLRMEFGDVPTIKYAGSHAKGTMIAEQYDLDIVCYFPSSETRSLKEIRDDVATHLRKKYQIDSKTSAERIINLSGTSVVPDGYHIDVVPGRFIEATKDVFLHLNGGEKDRMQTNLKVHIDYIAKSGCVPVIRLAKLWACRNNLGIKTFILELFVISALSGSHDKSNLKSSFLKVLTAFRDDFETTQLVDPANSNNVVSRMLGLSEKARIADAADESLASISESDDLDDWELIFNGERSDKSHVLPEVSIPTSVPDQGFTPRSPWSAAN